MCVSCRRWWLKWHLDGSKLVPDHHHHHQHPSSSPIIIIGDKFYLFSVPIQVEFWFPQLSLTNMYKQEMGQLIGNDCQERQKAMSSPTFFCFNFFPFVKASFVRSFSKFVCFSEQDCDNFLWLTGWLAGGSESWVAFMLGADQAKTVVQILDCSFAAQRHIPALSFKPEDAENQTNETTISISGSPSFFSYNRKINKSISKL